MSFIGECNAVLWEQCIKNWCDAKEVDDFAGETCYKESELTVADPAAGPNDDPIYIDTRTAAANALLAANLQQPGPFDFYALTATEEEASTSANE